MLALIAAYAQNRTIGAEGVIPWHIPGEQRRFRWLTTGQTVIMGRRTFIEIGRSLPNRTTIILSRTKTYQTPNCFTVRSLEEALERAATRHTFIAGGAALYTATLEMVEKMFLTEIHDTVPGDTFFPTFPESDFRRKVVASFSGELPYTYVTYTRIR